MQGEKAFCLKSFQDDAICLFRPYPKTLSQYANAYRGDGKEAVCGAGYQWMSEAAFPWRCLTEQPDTHTW